MMQESRLMADKSVQEHEKLVTLQQIV